MFRTGEHYKLEGEEISIARNMVISAHREGSYEVTEEGKFRDKCDGKIAGTKMVFKFLMSEIDLFDFPRYDLIVIIRIAQRFGCFNF